MDDYKEAHNWMDQSHNILEWVCPSVCPTVSHHFFYYLTRGDLVTHSLIFDNFVNFCQFWQFLTILTILTISDNFYNCQFFWIFLTTSDNCDSLDNFDPNDKDNPSDLWHLRHRLQFWQLRTWIHDNLCYLTIKSDTGQHSQFLRCFTHGFAHDMRKQILFFEREGFPTEIPCRFLWCGKLENNIDRQTGWQTPLLDGGKWSLKK